MDDKSRGAFSIWTDSAIFYVTHLSHLLLLFPLLCVPIVTDALQSLLIRQKTQGQVLSPLSAARQVWPFVVPLFRIKLLFEVRALLWGMIPIYGWVRAIKDRLHWAMASNVVVFEGLSGKAAHDRCRELIDKYSAGIGNRALFTVPTAISVMFLIAWVVAGTIYQPFYAQGFWLFLLMMFCLIVPWSGAANTLLYLELIRREKSLFVAERT
ncbi:hypothetical protein E3V36_07080 [Candidatus Marinimicrobia bacterium MT.SAG.2]|nr:hypothetical protein E3V36_07080 [Candidatus Marinimicrobia bacterium MT.SAG.2]